MEEESMFCPKCGKQIPDGAKFCGGCGNPVKAQQDRKIPVPPQNAQFAQAGHQASAPAPNLSSNRGMNGDNREEERKNRKLTIILFIVLAVLILVAAGMGVYYFKVLKNSDDGSAADRIEETDAREEAEEPEEQEEAESESKEETVDSQEAEEIEGVVSDTNEVVMGTVLENIPKAVYSYQFDDDLGNAKVVVRNDAETEPEETDDVEPQFERGMDGQAVYLDGTYGISLADVEKVGESYTVAFWMKAERLCDWSPFIHIGYDSLDPNKRVRLWIAQKTDGTSIAPIISSERAETGVFFEIRPGQSMPNTVEPNVWYHIAFTVDASKQGSRNGSVLGTLYVAGQRVGEGDIILDSMNVDDFEVYLGINCWDELYPAAFDDVKIWNQVLDDGQIQELYQAYE